MVQLAPLRTHRRNSAECAILTSKNNFVSGLVSVGKKSDLFVVSDSETSVNHYIYIKNIKNKTKVTGVCANLWNVLLQCNSHGTTANKNHHTLKINPMCHMDQTWSSKMLYRNIIGRDNFCHRGGFHSKYDNSKSFLCCCVYSSSARFSGSIT